MANFTGIVQKVKGLTASNWIAILLSIGLVVAIIITWRNQAEHEKLLILNKKHEIGRIRDSIKTAVRQERLDSLVILQAKLADAQQELEELNAIFEADDKKNRHRADSINRLLPARPKF